MLQFSESGEENLKGGLAMLTAEIIWLGALPDSMCVQVIDSQESLVARYAAVKSIIQY